MIGEGALGRRNNRGGALGRRNDRGGGVRKEK